MKTFFLCLANSKKYSGRCIAGIELEKTSQDKFIPLPHPERPKWIRPVSPGEHGSVDEKEVSHISLLDIVEIDVLKEIAAGYQAENVFFKKGSIQKIRPAEIKPAQLSKLTEPTELLFGNNDRSVSEEKIAAVNHSLTLIKAEKPELYIRPFLEKKHLRMKFSFSGTAYDFPVTDIHFREEYQKNNQLLEGKENVFVTVSLGILHEGWHYKLAAGVTSL